MVIWHLSSGLEEAWRTHLEYSAATIPTVPNIIIRSSSPTNNTVASINWATIYSQRLGFWPVWNTRGGEDQGQQSVSKTAITTKTSIFNVLFTAGPLCLSKHKPGKDSRLDDTFLNFKKFNRSLEYSCEQGDPGILEFTPNSSWPDIVYYNSFTQGNMGGKIHIIDSYSARTSSAVSHLSNILIVCSLYLFVKQFVWLFI